MLHLARPRRRTFKEGDRLVEDSCVSGDLRVAGGRVRQPQQVVRAARADTHAGTGMPPVLDIPSRELTRGREQNVRASELRRGVQQSERVLQLIAKSERAAGLIEGRPAPETATQ